MACKQCPAAKHAQEKCENATDTHLDRVSLNSVRPNCGNDADSEQDHGADGNHRVAMNVFDEMHEVSRQKGNKPAARVRGNRRKYLRIFSSIANLLEVGFGRLAVPCLSGIRKNHVD